MKRIILAIVIVSACIFSIQSANAQDLRKQQRLDTKKQATFVERRRQNIRQERREIVKHRKNIRQERRELRNDRVTFRAERRAGHPFLTAGVRHQTRKDCCEHGKNHRHTMNDLRRRHQCCY